MEALNSSHDVRPSEWAKRAALVLSRKFRVFAVVAMVAMVGLVANAALELTAPTLQATAILADGLDPVQCLLKGVFLAIEVLIIILFRAPSLKTGASPGAVHSQHTSPHASPRRDRAKPGTAESTAPTSLLQVNSPSPHAGRAASSKFSLSLGLSAAPE